MNTARNNVVQAAIENAAKPFIEEYMKTEEFQKQLKQDVACAFEQLDMSDEVLEMLYHDKGIVDTINKELEKLLKQSVKAIKSR